MTKILLDTDIGTDERVLQLLQQVRIDLFLAGDRVFERVYQTRTCLLNSLLQAVE